jgi:hypothetical protein
VTDWALKNGKATVNNGRLQMHDIYPEDDQFDHVVPKHPLSRVRNVLRRTIDSLQIDPGVKAHPRFELP